MAGTFGTPGGVGSSSCPEPGTSVTGYIDNQLTRFSQEAREFVELARNSLQDLLVYRGGVTYTPAEEHPPPEGVDGYAFDMPDSPERAPFDIQPPEEPARGQRQAVDVSRLSGFTVPEFDIPDPVYTIPRSPSLAPIGAPPSAPSMPVREMPSYVGMDLPPVPSLEELQIPDLPEVTIDSLQVERPDFEGHLPYLYDNNFAADKAALQTALAASLDSGNKDGDAVRARWNEMLLGGTGLPIEVEQALFDRGISREEINGAQAIHTAQTEWAARGFSLPGSAVLARVREVRTQNRDARAQLNREIVIQSHTQEIENLRFAVQQGIALEKQFMEKFSMTHDIALQVTDGAYRISQAIVEMRMAYVRMLVEIYGADIEAFKQKVQVELSKLEAFRSQLEAEKLRGDINLQRIELYKGQLQGVLAHVEVFKAEVEGVSAQIRGDLAQVELYRGRLDGYKTGLEAQKLQVDLYTARLQGEKIKADQYGSQVQSFAERVRAYGTSVDAATRAVGAEVSVRESQVTEYSTDIQMWQQKYQVQIKQLNANLRMFEADLKHFTDVVSARVEQVRVFDSKRRYQLDSAIQRTKFQLELAGQEVDALSKNADLELEATKATAQVAAQLAASAMAALNIGASISQSGSDSRSCSYSESLSTSVGI